MFDSRLGASDDRSAKRRLARALMGDWANAIDAGFEKFAPSKNAIAAFRRAGPVGGTLQNDPTFKTDQFINSFKEDSTFRRGAGMSAGAPSPDGGLSYIDDPDADMSSGTSGAGGEISSANDKPGRDSGAGAETATDRNNQEKAAASGFGAKIGHGSEEKAAIAALLYGAANTTGRIEYGGFIYQNGKNDWRFTFNTGTNDNINPKYPPYRIVPGETREDARKKVMKTVTSWYHVHKSGGSDSENERLLSGFEDRRGVRGVPSKRKGDKAVLDYVLKEFGVNMRSYLGTPQGRIIVFAPGKGRYAREIRGPGFLRGPGFKYRR